MTRAEERALEAYPKLSVASVCLDGTIPVDLNTGARKRFIEGYEQAEKDLALTWDDMELLHRLFAEEEENFSKHDKYFYTEVLTRFKQFKEGKQ